MLLIPEDLRDLISPTLLDIKNFIALRPLLNLRIQRHFVYHFYLIAIERLPPKNIYYRKRYWSNVKVREYCCEMICSELTYFFFKKEKKKLLKTM